MACPPLIRAPSRVVAPRGLALSIPVSAASHTPAQPITVAVAGLPDGLTFDASTGLITGDVDDDEPLGEVEVEVMASDHRGASRQGIQFLVVAAGAGTGTFSVISVPSFADFDGLGDLPIEVERTAIRSIEAGDRDYGTIDAFDAASVRLFASLTTPLTLPNAGVVAGYPSVAMTLERTTI